jgi:hypothetical protein
VIYGDASGNTQQTTGTSAGINYRSAVITAQIHDDAWYDDTNGRRPTAPAWRVPWNLVLARSPWVYFRTVEFVRRDACAAFYRLNSTFNSKLQDAT